MDAKFWEKIAALVESSKAVVDRPKGSSHPRFKDFVYPVDYGHLEGTQGGDGQEVDVWIGSLKSGVTGVLCTVDILKKDMELKILLGCSEEEENKILRAMNSKYMSAVLVRR
jgi:inorganic pyrophosphatase